MTFDNKIAIYIQIMDLIKRDIILGYKKAGDKLKSVKDLSFELKVNPNAIQKAYKELEKLNIVFLKPEIGTFIVEKDDLVDMLINELSLNIIDKFINEMKDITYKNNEILKRLEIRLEEEENNDITRS